MIHLPVDEIQPGMRVARSILGAGNGLALAAGFVLDQPVLDRLKKSGIRTLWVSMEGEEALPAGNVNDQLALQAQNAWKDNMDLLQKVGETQDSTLENLSRFKADPGRFKDIVATEKMKSIVDQILKSILGQEHLVVNLASIRTKDGYLYQHALDVTITATLIASRLKFTQQDIQELALGCFLMDLGMIIVPSELMEKNSGLTAQEGNLIREHPNVGFAILRANESVPINAAHVAYQHHERMDGSGFPRSLKGANQVPQKVLHQSGGQIHRYAEVASVADAYISAISPRPGSYEPLSPTRAMRMLLDRAGNQLNSHVVNALVTLIPAFPAGSRIMVIKAPKPSMVGFSGVVFKANPTHQDRPQVLLIGDRFRRKVSPILLDLEQEPGYEIQFAAS